MIRKPHIVQATDFSAASRTALRTTLHLACAAGAELIRLRRLARTRAAA
jgi:hypothetical protein